MNVCAPYCLANPLQVKQLIISDGSGNNTGNFQVNSLAVYQKTYSELLPVHSFYVAVYATQENELQLAT